MSEHARINALEDCLERIIDDPLVVKLLMFRDPKAWTDAVELLSDHDTEAQAGGARGEEAGT